MSEDESVSKPSDVIRYAAKSRKVPVESFRIPQRLILTYQRSAFDCAKNLIKGDCIEWLYGESQPFCVGHFNDIEVGIGRFWIGAPATAFTLEEAIACGARTVFEVGVSGGLQSYLRPSDIVVVTGAIRDEGTSHHYFPSEVEVESDTPLRDKLIKHLKAKGIRHFIGPVWSTDGAYRETRGKLRRFRDSVVMAVDMETSAVFAIAKYRNIRAASAQVISDVLTEAAAVNSSPKIEKGNTAVVFGAFLDGMKEAEAVAELSNANRLFYFQKSVIGLTVYLVLDDEDDSIRLGASQSASRPRVQKRADP